MATDDSNYIKQIDLVQQGRTVNIKVGEPHYIEVNYATLLEQKHSKKLLKGGWYRLTDYNVKDLTSCKFDILILATDTNVLSEECRAIAKEDSNPHNCNFDAWKIWYCLEDDGTKYGWNLCTDGYHGVIYRMIDEWGNDCPYDFKNVKVSFKGNEYYTFSHFNSFKDLSLNGDARNNTIGNTYTDYLHTTKIIPNIVLVSYSGILNVKIDNNCADLYLCASTYNLLSNFHILSGVKDYECDINNAEKHLPSANTEEKNIIKKGDDLIIWYA